ncbi:serine/arginine repetitive matrix protein 2 [Rhodotorula toruloides]|uniref:Serine/arginine repetitive matrix protein 2 n=1 Tax=Rhodotorula toruloides TaxID=5286 RepID=A0A511K7I4_RHOTO|nr:serine/arginine repetitive matrix protein 2 [Rhodotorula toruloides]
MANSEEDTKMLTVFKGVYAYVHGEFAGMTRRRIQRLVEQGGGKVINKLDNPKITHMILSPQLWSRHGTGWADLTIRRTIRANEENKTELDENYNRVWLLPLEWLTESLEKKKRLDERMHDYECTKNEQQNKKYGCKSRFGRGERKKYEREKAIAAEIAAQRKIEAEGINVDEQAFSGLFTVPNKGSLSSDQVKHSPQAHQEAKNNKLLPSTLKPNTPAEFAELATKNGSKQAAQKKEKRAKLLKAAERRETKKAKPAKISFAERKSTPAANSTAPGASSSSQTAPQTAPHRPVVQEVTRAQSKPGSRGVGTSRPFPQQFSLPSFGPAPTTTSSASASTSSSKAGEKRGADAHQLSHADSDVPLAQQVAKKRKLTSVAPSSDIGWTVKSTGMPSSEIYLLDSDY